MFAVVNEKQRRLREGAIDAWGVSLMNSLCGVILLILLLIFYFYSKWILFNLHYCTHSVLPPLCMCVRVCVYVF